MKAPVMLEQNDMFFGVDGAGYTIEQINNHDCEKFVISIHYAKRWPSVTWAFGLFYDGDLVGVVTYGTPASSPLRAGLAGESNIENVIELNRLCLKNNKSNEASRLVGRSLKMLPAGKLVISFADTAQNHIGYVYQATNFYYLGLSEKRTDWAIKGQEHLHGHTIGDRYRGFEDRAAAIRAEHGDNFYLKPRPLKHRYLFITGSKKDRKRLLPCVKYSIKPYPKAEKGKEPEL